MIHNDLILINGRLRDNEYYNSVLAYKLGEIEWGDKFIQTYTPYLNPDIRPDITNLVLAYKYFYLKEYELADNALIEVSYKNRIFYYAKVKVQIIRSLYEDWVNYKHNNAEALLNHCIAYEQKIKRSQKLSKDKKEGYLNFIKYFKALVQLKRIPKMDNKKLVSLFKKIKDTPLVTYKNWLLENVSIEKKR